MLYKLLSIAFILLVSLACFSCKGVEKISDINWDIMPKVVINHNAEIYLNGKDYSLSSIEDVYKKKLRLHIYVNGNCNTCVDKLSEWEKYIENFGFAEHYDILIHLFAYDYDNFKRINQNIVRFNHSIILDSENIFFLENGHLDIDMQEYQILTNYQNRMFDFGKLLDSNILESYLYDH